MSSMFFTFVIEWTPLWWLFPFPRIFVGTTVVGVGKQSVNGESVVVCVRSLFNDSASSERKNVVVFPAGVSLDVLAAVVVVAGPIRDWEFSWERLFDDEEEDDDDGGANSFKFIRSILTHSSRRRL